MEEAEQVTLHVPGTKTRRVILPAPQPARRITIRTPRGPAKRYRPPAPRERKPLWRDGKRFLEFFESFGIAIAWNALILLLLSLGAMNGGGRREVPEIVVMVSPSEKNARDEASSSSSSARKMEQKTTETHQRTPVEKAFRAESYSEMALPSFDEASFGSTAAAGSADFGIGNVIGKSGQEKGYGPGELGSIFDGKGLGDGSEMLLYLDVSGSMSRHSRKVAALVKSLFPRAKIIRVKGCAIVEEDGFVRALESNWSLRGKVFFVCDLQDPITYEGLGKLRKLLVESKPTKELHIISFQNRPVMDLRSIVAESWGSISVVEETSKSSG